MPTTRNRGRKPLPTAASFASQQQKTTAKSPTKTKKNITSTPTKTKKKVVTPSKSTTPKLVLKKSSQGEQPSPSKTHEYEILREELANVYHLYHTVQDDMVLVRDELGQAKNDLKEAQKEARTALKKEESTALKLRAAVEKNVTLKLEVTGLKQKLDLKKREHSFKLGEETNKVKTLQNILKGKEREITQLSKTVSSLDAQRQKAAAFSMKQDEHKRKIEMR